MSTELRVLLLEDVQTDAELAMRALQKAGISATSRRVESREAYLQALEEFKPEVILADYQLPAFDGLSALAIAREHCPEVPFIFVTGKMGEEVAIETLQKGATDYILKDRLSRLGPAVQRALSEAREHQHTADLQAQLAAIVESSSEGIIGMDLEGIVTSWNHGAEAIYGYSAAEMLGQPIERLSAPDCPQTMRTLIQEIRAGQRVRRNATQHVTHDGRVLDVSLSLAPIFERSGRLMGISALMLDISEQKQAERALIKKNRAMQTLSSCNETLVRATELEHLLTDMCRTIVQTGGYQVAWVGFADPRGEGPMRLMGQYGLAAAAEFAQLGEFRQNLARSVVRSGAPRLLTDAALQTAGGAPVGTMLAELRSVACLPLKDKSEVFGVLSICASDSQAFDEDALALLGELADDLAFGIRTLRMRAAHQENGERLERSMRQTIQAIANIVEIRDPYTAGHQRRVAQLATAIAHEMGLPEDRIQGLHLAGIVHDIGKIQIPAEILSKPGRLTKVEFQFIQLHSQAGFEILKEVEFPWPIAEIVGQHHERLDGSGYPKGLKGGDILLEAQILSVADVVEAMASHRPYRASLGIEVALQEISKQRGAYFVPEAVDACLTLFREKGYQLEP